MSDQTNAVVGEKSVGSGQVSGHTDGGGNPNKSGIAKIFNQARQCGLYPELISHVEGTSYESDVALLVALEMADAGDEIPLLLASDLGGKSISTGLAYRLLEQHLRYYYQDFNIEKQSEVFGPLHPDINIVFGITALLCNQKSGRNSIKLAVNRRSWIAELVIKLIDKYDAESTALRQTCKRSAGEHVMLDALSQAQSVEIERLKAQIANLSESSLVKVQAELQSQLAAKEEELTALAMANDCLTEEIAVQGQLIKSLSDTEILKSYVETQAEKEDLTDTVGRLERDLLAAHSKIDDLDRHIQYLHRELRSHGIIFNPTIGHGPNHHVKQKVA